MGRGDGAREQATLKHSRIGDLHRIISPDGKTLASADLLGAINLRDMATGKVQTAFKVGVLNIIAFCPDGKTLASSARLQGTIKLWDLATGKERGTLEQYMGGVSALAYSPDGKTLAAAGLSGDIKLWDVATGKEKAATQRGCTDRW